ncbi:MAG: hypothetical protein EON87_10410 [Brevundimonas sp.]|nr:MAG: hypothetical protein EON87_10410 [Brevundimonas sp.]
MQDTTKPKPKRSIWQIALTAVVFIAAAGLARYCTSNMIEGGKRAFTSAELETELDRVADTDPVFRTFRDGFPQDWQAFRSGLGADYKTTRSLAELKQKSATRVRAFMFRRVAWTTAAPPAELNAALGAERAFIEQLQRDNVQYCATFGMTGLRGDEALSQQATQLVSQVGVAKLVATRAGRDRPVAYGPMTEQDAQALFTGMGSGGASPDIVQLMANGGADGTPEQLCTGSVALYRSMDAMPGEQAARVFGAILTNVARAQIIPTTM